MVFAPKINNSFQFDSKTFIDKLEQKNGIRRKKLEEQKEEYIQAQQEKFKKDCTFRPKINKSRSVKARKVEDMLRWKEELDKKLEQNKKEMEVNYSFAPQINKTSVPKRVSSIQDYDNAGDRMFKEHQMKQEQKKSEQGTGEFSTSHLNLIKTKMKQKMKKKQPVIINEYPELNKYLQK